MNNAPQEEGAREGVNARTAAKHWLFTLNNPTPAEEQYLSQHLSTQAVLYAVYQHEIGSSGTHHLQGYIEFRSVRRFRTLHELLPRAHFENRRGTREQARDYCTKLDSRVEGTQPFEFGNWTDSPGQGTRSDITKVCNFLRTNAYRDAILEYPVECARFHRYFREYRNMVTPSRTWQTKVYLFIGPTGTGKTRTAHHLYPQLWTKPPGLWYDSYDAHETVLFDDFDGTDIPFCFLLRLLDRYALWAPVKGSYVNWVPKIIIITSNHEPDEWYHRGNPEFNAPLIRRITAKFAFPLSGSDRAALAALGPLPPSEPIRDGRNPPSPLDSVLLRQ